MLAYSNIIEIYNIELALSKFFDKKNRVNASKHRHELTKYCFARQEVFSNCQRVQVLYSGIYAGWGGVNHKQKTVGLQYSGKYSNAVVGSFPCFFLQKHQSSKRMGKSNFHKKFKDNTTLKTV